MVGEKNLTFQPNTTIWEWVLSQHSQNGGMTRLSMKNSSIKLTFQTCVFNKMQTLPLRTSDGGQMSNSKRWSKIRDYVFTTQMVPIGRLQNLLLELAKRNAP